MSTNNTNALSLTPIKPDNLILYANASDVRRDLHTYVNYVNGRTIKRSYCGNELPPADYKRLSQLMNIQEPADKSDHEPATPGTPDCTVGRLHRLAGTHNGLCQL